MIFDEIIILTQSFLEWIKRKFTTLTAFTGTNVYITD